MALGWSRGNLPVPPDPFHWSASRTGRFAAGVASERLRPVRRVALIVNPQASGVDERKLARVAEALGRAARVETARTERAGHGAELAAEAGGAADAVVCFSGDGGFNEVLNGLAADIPVGFVPGGAANVLPRALGLPRDPVRAAERLAESIVNGRTRRISLGRVNGRRFSFAAGVGFDAELIRRVEAKGRSSTGRRRGSAYALWAATRILVERRGRIDPQLEVAGLGRAAFVLVGNTDPHTYLGRLQLRPCPDARFELGLDVAAPAAVRPGSVPRLLGYALLGRDGADGVLRAHDVDRVEVVCDGPLPLQADGEDLGDVDRVVFESEREAVTVYI
jgi:diacylglycerol kinase family enzyme